MDLLAEVLSRSYELPDLRRVDVSLSLLSATANQSQVEVVLRLLYGLLMLPPGEAVCWVCEPAMDSLERAPRWFLRESVHEGGWWLVERSLTRLSEGSVSTSL